MSGAYQPAFESVNWVQIKKTLSPYREVLGGFFGGAAGIFITHPLDTIRVRAQVAKGSSNPSFIGIAKNIFKCRGLLGFYAGVVPPVFFRGFGFSANRWGYAFAKEYSDNSCILGAVAGWFNVLCDTPVYCLKNRVQCSDGKFKESIPEYLRMGRHILKTEGITGLYAGHVPMMILGCGSYACFYAVYDPMLAAGYSAPICGIAAVVACWPPFYPFDVLRTRAQVVTRQTARSKQFFKFRYFCAEMWAQPVARWFPGMSVTLVRAVPRYGCAMGICEAIRSSLDMESLKED